MRAVLTIAGDTANVLLYREIGRSDDEAEAAFWLLNPDLAEHGTAMPSGVRVYLPELEEKAAPSTRASVWE